MTEHIDLGQFGTDFGFDEPSFIRVSTRCSHLLAGLSVLGWDEDKAVQEVALHLSGEDDAEVVRYAALLGYGFVRSSGMGAVMEELGPENMAGMIVLDDQGNQMVVEEVVDPGMKVAVSAVQTITALARKDSEMVKALVLGQPDRVGLIYTLAKTAAAVMIESDPRPEG